MSLPPPFLRKLWDMVNDPENASIICWLEDGEGFKVLKPRELGAQILPKYFNGTLCSFIRQLNLYGFNKIGDEFAFRHYEALFKRGHEDKLQFIERRKNIKTRSRSDVDNGQNKQQKVSNNPVKSQEPKPEPEHENSDAPVAQLIHSHNAHDFMINWLTSELQHQQRETALLRQQLGSLTQYVLSNAATSQGSTATHTPAQPQGSTVPHASAQLTVAAQLTVPGHPSMNSYNVPPAQHRSTNSSYPQQVPVYSLPNQNFSQQLNPNLQNSNYNTNSNTLNYFQPNDQLKQQQPQFQKSQQAPTNFLRPKTDQYALPNDNESASIYSLQDMRINQNYGDRKNQNLLSMNPNTSNTPYQSGFVEESEYYMPPPTPPVNVEYLDLRQYPDGSLDHLGNYDFTDTDLR
jgi:hypothetical protein